MSWLPTAILACSWPLQLLGCLTLFMTANLLKVLFAKVRPRTCRSLPLGAVCVCWRQAALPGLDACQLHAGCVPPACMPNQSSMVNRGPTAACPLPLCLPQMMASSFNRASHYQKMHDALKRVRC